MDRNGSRLGHDKIIDGLLKDGLWDVYNDFGMGVCAEICAEQHSITREEQVTLVDLFGISTLIGYHYSNQAINLCCGTTHNLLDHIIASAKVIIQFSCVISFFAGFFCYSEL